MSSSRSLLRAALIVLALAGTAALSGCTGLRPVYGQPSTGVENHVFFYGTPVSRLDQVIYNDLRLRLGPHSESPDAVRVAISTTTSARALTRSAVLRPSQQNELIVTATVVLTAPDGEVLFRGTRRASADYQVVSQVLADTAAATDATERAGRAVAETIRLTIISVLEGRG